VTEEQPAWSATFQPDALPRVKLDLPLGAITPEWAWGGSTGAGVKVAIVDSGIDATHPAVGGVNGYVAVSGNEERLMYDVAPHSDAYGHGTACAGIIRSFAPDCELYSVKVLGANLSGKGITFAGGLRWAIDQHMDICNLSLGTTRRDFYSLLHELADAAAFQHMLLVTAANNLPVPSYPSIYSSVISVASHYEADPHCFYYNPNPPAEFGARGIDVPVAWMDGGYLTMTGNSFAAPHITGLLARIRSKHPSLTLVQARVVLQALAANVRRCG
jgi:subtilisin family serine protease